MPDVGTKWRRWSEAQALTRAAPTVITEGMECRGVTGYRVVLSADSTRTLSGAGTLACYLWDNDLARWVRNPSLDLTVTASSVRDQAWPDFEMPVDSGRVLYAASSVTVSAGACTVAIKGRVLR